MTGPVGNPLGHQVGGDLASSVPLGGEETWQHRRVFAARGLVDLHRAHGLTELRLFGAGYYAFPRWLATLNPSHAAFIAVAGVRP